MSVYEQRTVVTCMNNLWIVRESEDELYFEMVGDLGVYVNYEFDTGELSGWGGDSYPEYALYRDFHQFLYREGSPSGLSCDIISYENGEVDMWRPPRRRRE